jgi:uncharacterized protein (TIGR02145 family)
MVLNILKILSILIILIQAFSCTSVEFDNKNDPRNGAVYVDLCADFEEGTIRENHYGKDKPQFCDERDGKKYVYVTIGEGETAQIWMAENLNYDVVGSRCYGDHSGGDTQDNCRIYGRLYYWETAMNNICPQGWHLPSAGEWRELINIVGGAENGGWHLKTSGSWYNHNDNSDGGGTDDYGFSALPGGNRYPNGDFINIGFFGHWWSSNESDLDDDIALYFGMAGYFNYSYMEEYNKRGGFSVRCLKD